VLDFWNNDSDPICLSIHYALIRSLMRAGWSQRGGRKPQPVAKCRGWGSLWKPYLSRDIVPLPPFNLIVVFQHSSIKKERAPLSARGKRPSSIDFVEQKDLGFDTWPPFAAAAIASSAFSVVIGDISPHPAKNVSQCWEVIYVKNMKISGPNGNERAERSRDKRKKT